MPNLSDRLKSLPSLITRSGIEVDIPKTLKGSEIPLARRVTAIADVFDALTSKRPYKEAFLLESAFAIIKEGKGSHFDPEVVDAFFAVEDEILSIKERYKDWHPSPLIKRE